MPCDLWEGFRRADVFELMRELPDACIDLTVTDPPYESQERHRKAGTTTRLSQSKSSSNRWFPTIPNEEMPEFFAELYRAHKPRTFAYILCDEPTAEVFKSFARDAGFWVWKSVIVVKMAKNGNPKGGMGYHWRNCTERALMLEKTTAKQLPHMQWNVCRNPRGKKASLNHKGWVDLIECPAIRTDYPAEKPVELLSRLVENSSQIGDLVFDPFAGSGSLAEACMKLCRRWMLADNDERSESAYNARMARLREAA